MVEIEKINQHRYYNNQIQPAHTHSETQSEDITNLIPKKEKSNQGEIKNKISTEELMKSLMKPKEIKRLLYLIVPFTRHFINDLDQRKGLYIDKEG